jgi:hypothetical protein
MLPEVYSSMLIEYGTDKFLNSGESLSMSKVKDSFVREALQHVLE